jgi:hypothetical protein
MSGNNSAFRGNFAMRDVILSFLFLLALPAAYPAPAWAGPPFVTDDPEPVEYRHWEVYAASQYQNDSDGVQFTAPHVEVNYGVVPNMQLHLIVPLLYANPRGEASNYGPGDVEIGVKYRFAEETRLLPQAGIFPLVELPSGDSERNLGSGEVQAFLPLWLQKSFGNFTTYGGGGYWINPGAGNKNYWLLGWEAQYDLSEALTLGGEIFHYTASSVGGGDRTGFNAGGIINIDDHNHILFSAGTDFHGPALFSMYAAYQLAFGPSGLFSIQH